MAVFWGAFRVSRGCDYRLQIMTDYRDSDIIDEKEGWECEDSWRYGVFKRNPEFIERYIPNGFGSEYMK